jgi:hypothetical protein
MTIESTVDLPQPEWPSRQTNSPSRIFRSKLLDERAADVLVRRQPRQAAPRAGPRQVDADRRADRAAGVERHDAVGEEHGLVDVVRDEKRRAAIAGDEARELVLERRACERIERAERLVEEQEARLGREAARDGDALAHAARELARALLRRDREADEPHPVCRPDAPPLGGAVDRHRVHGQPDVVLDREPGEQRVVLEDHAALGAGSVDRSPVDEHRALVGRNQAGDDRHERRLAGARRADDGEELALLDREVDAHEHGLRTAGARVALRDAAELEQRHVRPPARAARRRPSGGRGRSR